MTDSPNLPTPHDRPDANIVIYDGECVFCCGQVQRLANWDWLGKLAFLSLHAPEVAERFPDLTHDQLMEQMWVVAPNAKRYGGAAALRFLSRRLPMLSLLAPLLHIPFSLPLWNWAYRQVAQRRYQIAGRKCENGACEIHFRN